MDWGYILCVDDDWQELSLLANQLQEEFSRSHIVYKAGSIEEASMIMDMLQASQKRIELILCKQHMARVQGDSFLEAIHKANPEIMKLLIFAPGDLLDSAYLLSRATIQNFIEAPWKREHLILTVESLLKLYKISQHIEEIQELGLQFGPIFDLHDLLRQTIHSIEGLTTASKVAVATTDGQTVELRLLVSNEPEGTVMDELSHNAIAEMLRKVFARQKDPLVFNNVAENQYLQQFDIPEWYQARHLACIPLWRKEDFFGVLFMGDKRSGLPFFREDILLAKIIAYQLLASLENIRLTEDKLRLDRLSTIGNMANEIIHDLKGPMTTIMGFAELLERDDCTPIEKKQFSGLISSEVEQMVEMVEEILEFSRGGKMRLNLMPCNVEQLVAEVAEVLQRTAKDQDIRITTRLTCKKRVFADSDKLKRVFFNIAKNAIEAMRDGGRLSINTYPHQDTHLEFRLADSGPGIPPQVKEHIFEPFVTYGKKRGTGLGMSIAKKIVNDHGGDIWVESEEGKGTIFYFTVPIAREK